MYMSSTNMCPYRAVGDELVKIVRINRSSDCGDNSNDFSQQVLSGVRFTPLLSVPSAKTVLPSRVWSPSVHHSYPESFRKSSKELLMCSHAPYIQPIPAEQRPVNRVNLAATLPRVIWMDILSYTHHNWFEPPQSEEVFLHRRLLEEQDNARKAHTARMEAEARCHVAERERDVYRLLARRWQCRLQHLLQQQRNPSGNNNGVDLEDEVFTLNGRESAAIFGLGAMLRGFQSDSDDESEDEEHGGANDMDAEDTEQNGHQEDEAEEDIDEDSDNDNYVFLSDDEEVQDLEDSEASMSLGDPDRPSSSAKALVIRPQVRTVSISGEL